MEWNGMEWNGMIEGMERRREFPSIDTDLTHLYCSQPAAMKKSDTVRFINMAMSELDVRLWFTLLPRAYSKMPYVAICSESWRQYAM